MKKLSACMMVKNEESNIIRCLDSIYDFVDEIIIVDTGSTDKTIEMIKNFNKGKIRIYHHEWENNFSVHRNQSIEYATGDYVFIVDADEQFFLGADKKIIREDIEKIFTDKEREINAISIRLDDFQAGTIRMSFNSARFFKKGEVIYERAVHNKPKMEGLTGIYTGCSIMHYGYDLTPSQQLEKKKRSIPLLIKAIEDNPTDFESHFYLNQYYNILGEIDNSIVHGNIYLASYEEGKTFNSTVFFTMFRNNLMKGDIKSADEILRKGLEIDPSNIDLHMASVELGVNVGDHMLIEASGQIYLQTYDEYNANPKMKEGKFTFGHTIEGLSYVLHVLSMTKLQVALNQASKLNEVFGLMDCKHVEKVKIELTRESSEIGMPSLMSIFTNNGKLSEAA